MVFYLQAQIGIETGEYATVKKRLVPRVRQHPNDMVALSLLECCIYHEFSEWETEHPAPPQTLSPALPELPPLPVPSADSPFGNVQAASAAAFAATYDGSAPEPADVASPSVAALRSAPGYAPATPELIEIQLQAIAAAPAPSAPKPAPVTPVLGREATIGHRAAVPPAPVSASAALSAVPASESDMGPYQTLTSDPNTHGLALWNHAKGKAKSTCRKPEFELVLAVLPRELPGAIQAAAAALDGGTVHKICFCFQNLTATTFHSGAENMGLLTGNINQSLLTIVRAENSFRKSVPALAAAATARAAEGGP